MAHLKTILVTGANGQLGSEFKVLAPGFTDFKFIFMSREQLAIDDVEAVTHFFSTHNIDICINCAAYTAVDKAEVEKELALSINVTAVANLAMLCKKKGVQFFHFSTDYVFNGNATVPYTPEVATDPVNFYGLTKLQGEQAALQQNSEAIIIRTSWVYSSFGKNFVKTILRLMKEKEAFGVVSDQLGCPTYAADLAAAVMQIIQSQKWLPGIYHYCNAGVISWYEFALAIKKYSGSNCDVNAIATAQYPTPAKRPAYSALDTRKIKEAYNVVIPSWELSLQCCIKLL